KKSPDSPGQFAMYLDGKWHMLRFNKDLRKDAGPIEKLDVSILQDYLLSPILGISDPRTDSRIAFIGGRRGTDELERLVDSGEFRLAFSMYPTAIDDLINVADSGEVMPPKSTWFEPKLKDGLFIHEITHETGSTARENQADLNLSAGS
ncbi:MAG TPA: hypothetical protein VNK26_07605, partial [Pyrinomonadaceae bacterium]|nr:hypothetical protein [Pyrinomonadaceae bacterium]